MIEASISWIHEPAFGHSTGTHGIRLRQAELTPRFTAGCATGRGYRRTARRRPRAVRRQCPFAFASGNSVRISKIEIMGSTRTNRNISITNIPMVPMKVAQSHTVG
jgi:hypothetical protein